MPVALRHHIVVLGWTSRTLPLLRELLDSSERVRRFLKRNDVRRMRLVVLSENASAEQLLQLRNEPGIGHRAKQIICARALRSSRTRCSALRASTPPRSSSRAALMGRPAWSPPTCKP